MDDVLCINDNVKIVNGFAHAVAYNFHSLRAFEFDKEIGGILESYLPSSRRTLLSIAQKKKLINSSEERGLLATLFSNLVKNQVLKFGESFHPPRLSNTRLPKVSTLVLELLTRCNFRCRHCYLGKSLWSKEALKYSLIQTLLRSAKEMGVQRVQITGGNPLLHPDIMRILNILKDYSFEIILFSNGTKLTMELLAALERSGASLHLSIYGMSDQSAGWFTGQKNYSYTIKDAITRIRTKRVNIRSLDYMVVEENLNEIQCFIDFCEKEHLPYRFDLPAPVGNARINKVKNVNAKITTIKSRFESSDLLKTFRFNSCLFDQPTILANGDVTFCILSNRTFDDFILGNVNTSTLQEVWFGKKVEDLFKQTNVDAHHICKDCEYKYLCGGLCPFSSKFHKLHVTREGAPSCRKFRNKKFRSWEIKCET